MCENTNRMPVYIYGQLFLIEGKCFFMTRVCSESRYIRKS